jgi:hypothetical protein
MSVLSLLRSNKDEDAKSCEKFNNFYFTAAQQQYWANEDKQQTAKSTARMLKKALDHKVNI